MEEKKLDLSLTTNNLPHPISNQVNSKYETRKKYIDFAKIGEKLSLTGSNCHYCKSIMTVGDSNACRYTFSKSTILNSKNNKKRTCNKKFCFDCLKKHFHTYWEGRFNKDWQCPCCSGDCTCIQCRKLMLKEKQSSESKGLLDESPSIESGSKYDKTLFNNEESKEANLNKGLSLLLNKLDSLEYTVSIRK